MTKCVHEYVEVLGWFYRTCLWKNVDIDKNTISNNNAVEYTKIIITVIAIIIIIIRMRYGLHIIGT